MTLATNTARSAVHSDVVALPKPGKVEEEEPLRTGPNCCPKEKIVVFPGTYGSASIKCPNCGKYALFDYDSLTAKPGRTCRGASKRACADKT